MAEITRRRLGEITRTVFSLLAEAPDGMQVRTLTAQVEARLQLTEFEKSMYENSPGSRRFDKIIRFGTIGPVKAGWLIKDRGLWRITPEGKAALQKFPDPEEFTRESDRLYREWKRSIGGTASEAPTVSEEEITRTVLQFEEAEESAWNEIQAYLENINPYSFQDLVAGLLKGMGYSISWVSPPGRDGGMDIVAFSDPLGSSVPRIKVQVKRRGDKINVEGIRSFLALLGDDDVGIFVSLGGFTADAAAEARNHPSRRMTLIDIERLFDLWVEYYSRLDEKVRKLLPLRPVYFLSQES